MENETTGEGVFRNRNYSSQQGRFTSQDPIRFASGQMNHYQFVGNRPLMGTDPSGLREIAYDPGKLFEHGQVSNDGKYFVLNTPVEGKPKVPIRNDRVDFGAWSKGDVVIAITGDSDFDIRQAKKAYRAKYGRIPNNVTFHRDPMWTRKVSNANGDSMLLGRMAVVPSELNAKVPHSGSASVARDMVDEMAAATGDSVENVMKSVKQRSKAYNNHRLKSGHFSRGGVAARGVAASVAAAAAAEFAALAYYEYEYLTAGAGMLDTGKSIILAHKLNIYRSLGVFGDVDGTPFPSDEQLRRGVQLEFLAFRGSLRDTLERTDVPDLKKMTVYEGLIMHIVSRDGHDYWQVQ